MCEEGETEEKAKRTKKRLRRQRAGNENKKGFDSSSGRIFVLAHLLLFPTQLMRRERQREIMGGGEERKRRTWMGEQCLSNGSVVQR